MKNAKLKELVTKSKLPNLTGDMISLDCEMIRAVKGGIVPPISANGVCEINNTGCK